LREAPEIHLRRGEREQELRVVRERGARAGELARRRLVITEASREHASTTRLLLLERPLLGERRERLRGLRRSPRRFVEARELRVHFGRAGPELRRFRVLGDGKIALAEPRAHGREPDAG